MTNKEFISKLLSAVSSKTLYIKGCFGAPMNDKNKKRYTSNNPTNERPERYEKIMNASTDTFGFDCSGLVKGILWGWDADKDKTYGGAKYESNGVPDTTINSLLLNYCTDQSDDFTNIQPGEFLVMDGHCGVYIGNGEAVESTIIWDDGVQITEVWNIKKTSSHGRKWTSHGKLKAVEYIDTEPKEPIEILVIVAPSATLDEISTIETGIKALGYDPKILIERG